MKYVKTLLYLFTLAAIITACQKGLDRQPLDTVSPPLFFKKESDLKGYTNLMYNNFQGAGEIYEGGADDIVKSSVSPDIAGTRLVPNTDGNWNWDQLRQINYFLTHENVVNYPNEAVKNKYVGVAKFFRALFYFEKVKRFGDVPWYNVVIETNDEANLRKARDPRTLIMDSIMADLDFAIQHLGTEKSVERVTRWTALALKSRIGLYEGSWRKYHTEFNLPDAAKFLEASIAASEELMNSGQYSLYKATNGPTGKPYMDLFATMTLDPLNSEVIIGRRYSNTLTVFHNLQFYMTARTQGKPGFEKRLVNSYLMADGKRFTDIAGYDTMQFYNEVQNRDPRLYQSIRTPGYTRVGQTAVASVDFEGTMTGYQPVKGLNHPNMDGSSQSYKDLILFRFGEILLNYAEAKAELGSLTQADIDRSVNLLRDRVGMPNLIMAEANANPDAYQAALYNNLSGANQGVLLEIRRERRVELVMENGLRWDDIMRWKEGHLLADPFLGTYFPGPGFYNLDRSGGAEIEIYSGSRPPATAGAYQLPVSELDEGVKGNIMTNRNIVKTFNENRDYLYPLPIEQTTLNPNLGQNPGWRE